jgi:hypothetical protein
MVMVVRPPPLPVAFCRAHWLLYRKLEFLFSIGAVVLGKGVFSHGIKYLAAGEAALILHLLCPDRARPAYQDSRSVRRDLDLLSIAEKPLLLAAELLPQRPWFSDHKTSGSLTWETKYRKTLAEKTATALQDTERRGWCHPCSFQSPESSGS